MNILKKLLGEATNGAYWIGHSFGAVILLEALVQECIDTKNTITLLQPPVAKRNSKSFNAPQFMNKWALKFATANLIERYVLDNGLFERTDSIPENYLAKVEIALLRQEF